MSLGSRVMEFIRGMDAPTEAGSIRDGVLSHATEWHALVIGLGAGFVSELLQQPIVAGGVIGVALGLQGMGWARRRLSSEVVDEVRQEPWYAVGGVLAGYGIGVLV